MRGYDPATYGDRIAPIYDRLYGDRVDAEAVAETLAGLAGAGPALELGIGTGLIALPLAARGVDVRGVDASAAMVAKLRAKPGGDRIPVTMGDFADVPVAGPFALVYVPFNTLFALTTQEAQLRCVANVAARLAPGGRFLVEAFVPDLTRYARNQTWSVVHVETNAVWLDAVRHDPAEQRLDLQHIQVSEAGTRLYPVRLRYVWPAELDLMARLAGLALEHRWGGWAREPFGSESTRHVSVYRLGPEGDG